ncbi:MAG: hypothetical protein JWO48_1453 [Bryobacterales bacterium]|nr:hypothetical protein [Bryobacterales bacterium]
MPECPECQRLKYKVDIAAALSVETAESVLRLDGNTPESSTAIQEMRKAKQQLDEYEIRFEAHVAEHANSARLRMVS